MPPKKINQVSGMPQMGAAFSGWQSSITLGVVSQPVVDGFVEETVTETPFMGVIQPLIAKELALKPEGQRAYKWLQIHAFAGSLNLDTADKIVYGGERFEIMAVKDYSLNNYIEYHAVKDYEAAT